MWVPLTPPEVVYLAEADPDEPNLLDRLLVAGGWLRMEAMRAAGEQTFRARLEAARDDVPHDIWAGLVQAAGALAHAASGHAIALRRGGELLGTVVTAHLPDVTSQLLIRGEELGLRWGSRPEMRTSLAEELPLVPGCDAVHAVVWDAAEGERQLVWAAGRLVQSDGADGATTDRVDDLAAAVAALVDLVEPTGPGVVVGG